jgi:hypothetical protein
MRAVPRDEGGGESTSDVSPHADALDLLLRLWADDRLSLDEKLSATLSGLSSCLHADLSEQVVGEPPLQLDADGPEGSSN